MEAKLLPWTKERFTRYYRMLVRWFDKDWAFDKGVKWFLRRQRTGRKWTTSAASSIASLMIMMEIYHKWGDNIESAWRSFAYGGIRDIRGYVATMVKLA